MDFMKKAILMAPSLDYSDVGDLNLVSNFKCCDENLILVHFGPKIKHFYTGTLLNRNSSWKFQPGTLCKELNNLINSCSR